MSRGTKYFRCLTKTQMSQRVEKSPMSAINYCIITQDGGLKTLKGNTNEYLQEVVTTLKKQRKDIGVIRTNNLVIRT